MPERTPKNPSYPDCVAYCPRCGADLVFIQNECICKKHDCGWSCQGCKEDDDV